ncbi:MAG: saccharopine dehydrogenase NADP-binding domain-containing protein [Bacteroidia bacterium]|nr:saccharopine dehydrogenase NADP-binding domain-containing protein [Bacteroidia bacterium]
MKHILIIGAGRSSTSLITYLLESCRQFGWSLTLGDLSQELAASKVGNTPNAEAIRFDIHDEWQREREISRADLVISMLPAMFHFVVAESCIKHQVPLLTASYVSDEIQKLHEAAVNAGVMILMECGLDPGIDHMSAMKVLDSIRESGATLRGFETFTGGLLAPESTGSNPWEYKFTWNPRNVVLAGQGTVKFIQEGKYKFIPYHKLFRRTEVINIPGYGYFEGYANRDSLKYLDVYKLRDIKTLYRGTLRRVGFCRAWDIFIQLGATEDSYRMEGVATMTHRQFINSFLSYDPDNTVELKLAHYLKLDLDGPEMYKLHWLGMFEEEPIGLNAGTPAEILEHILKKKWTLNESDKDMIVMWHKFDFLQDGKLRQIQSHMVVTGENDRETGMAKTVGLPLGIAAELMLQKKIYLPGVQIPVHKEIYLPILEKLTESGVTFQEREIHD